MNRRGFITGLIALVAAPAIVRAGSLMPVKAEIIRPLRPFVITGILQGKATLYGGRSGQMQELLGDWRNSLQVGDIVTFSGIRMER